MELAAAILFAAEHVVETIGPVDTQKADHGQEDAHADSGRPFHVEGIEILHARLSITALDEGQGIDVG